jgi:hypothetical protein
LHGQVHRFAFALCGDPALAGHLARSAIDTALDTAPASRFVAAALADVRRQVDTEGIDRRSGDRVDTFEEGVERAVLLLVDDDGLTPEDVATVLAIEPDDVTRHLRRGRRRIGVAEDVSRCPGWALVRRLALLTPGEAVAAKRHLALCRSCAEAHAAREASRARLRRVVPATGAAGTGIAAGVSALLSLGGSAGVGAAAGAAVVAGAIAAPLAILPHVGHASHRAGVGSAAVQGSGRADSAAGRRTHAGAGSPGSTAGSAGLTQRGSGAPQPVGSVASGTGMPTTAPSSAPGVPIGRSTSPLPPTALPTPSAPSTTPPPTVSPTLLPTLLPTALPTLLPTTSPTLLPTALPTLLPTALPTLLPTSGAPLPCLPLIDPGCG